MIKHYCTKGKGVVAHELIYENMKLYLDCFSALPADRRLVMTLEEYKPFRSDKQNAYYWAVVIKYFCEEMGELAEDMHEILKGQFLKEEIEGHAGLFRIGSTTDLTTATFWDYIEECRKLYFKYFNGVIPDPYITGYRERQGERR